MTLLNLIENDNKEKIPLNVDGKIKLTEKITNFYGLKAMIFFL